MDRYSGRPDDRHSGALPASLSMSGRDKWGRFLPGPDWPNLPASCHSPTSGRVFRKTKYHSKSCGVCGGIFDGYAAQRYCGKPCKRRAQTKRDEAGGIYRSGGRIKFRYRGVREVQRCRLPLRERTYDRDGFAYDPARLWSQQPPPPLALMIPFTDELEDAVARLMDLGGYVYHQMLGKPTNELTYMGKTIYVGSLWVKLLHDVLLGGVRTLRRNVT